MSTSNWNQAKYLASSAHQGTAKQHFFSSLCGLLPFDKGEITVGEKSIRSEESAANSEALWDFRKKSGIVFQHLHLFPHLTVLGNIIEAPVQVNKKNRTEAENEAKETPEKLGITQHMNKYPEELSGGEQQRVAILPRPDHEPRSAPA